MNTMTMNEGDLLVGVALIAKASKALDMDPEELLLRIQKIGGIEGLLSVPRLLTEELGVPHEMLQQALKRIAVADTLSAPAESLHLKVSLPGPLPGLGMLVEAKDEEVTGSARKRRNSRIRRLRQAATDLRALSEEVA